MPRRARDRSARPARPFPSLGAGALLALVALAALAATACEPTASDPSTLAASSTTTTGAVVSPTTVGDGAPSEAPTTTGPTERTDPTTLPSSIVTGGTTVSHTPGTRSTGSPDQVTDIAAVDFTDHWFPASSCGGVIDHPPTAGFDLVDGEARGGSPAGEDAYLVTLEPTMTYGDIDGDGVDDASLVLDCGRGNRAVPVGWLYTLDAGRTVPLARVALDPESLPLSGVLDTDLSGLRIEGDAVVTDWVIYLDGDALCCPSRTAAVIWTWTGGELVAGPPTIARTRPGS